MKKGGEGMRQAMTRALAVVCLGTGLALGGATAVQAQGTQGGEGKGGRLSGYAFGDVYWMAANHETAYEGQNGFWFRRIYFTYDQALGGAFDMRIRFEFNSPGDFKTKAKLEPFIKDAYVRWTRGGHSVYLGVSPTPTWEVIEGIWGYRSVEKTPLDLQKFGESRDFGVAVQGRLDAKARVRYHVMLSNGGGTASETNKGKMLLGSLGAQLTDALFLEVYADWDNRPARTDRYTWQVFAAYRRPDYRVGLQFAQQARQQEQGETEKLELVSGFLVARLAQKLHALARVDRMFDANPDGGKISYLPFDAEARSVFVVAGVDYTPHASVHLIPNLEFVGYERTFGYRPEHDLMVRLTFYYIW